METVQFASAEVVCRGAPGGISAVGLEEAGRTGSQCVHHKAHRTHSGHEMSENGQQCAASGDGEYARTSEVGAVDSKELT